MIDERVQDWQIYANAFKHSPIGMAIITLAGRWFEVNPSFCKLLGYTKNEFNPLTSLRGFVQLEQSEDKDDKNKFRHEVMLSEIDRINEIVSELLVLAKPANEKFQLSSVAEKLDHVITLFEGQAHLHNCDS